MLGRPGRVAKVLSEALAHTRGDRFDRATRGCAECSRRASSARPFGHPANTGGDCAAPSGVAPLRRCGVELFVAGVIDPRATSSDPRAVGAVRTSRRRRSDRRVPLEDECAGLPNLPADIARFWRLSVTAALVERTSHATIVNFLPKEHLPRVWIWKTIKRHRAGRHRRAFCRQ